MKRPSSSEVDTHMTKIVRIVSVLFLCATLTLPWTARFGTTVSAQHEKMAMTSSSHQQHKGRKHMHMKNWALEPTGVAGVFPLDPNAIPKFRNQLIRMPTHVPIGTKREPSTGRNLPLYEVTQAQVQIPLLPPGFPT